jgi:hypothetical protein
MINEMVAWIPVVNESLAYDMNIIVLSEPTAMLFSTWHRRSIPRSSGAP